MKTFFAELSAKANSARFVAYTEGAQMRLASGELVEVKVASVEKSIRPQGLKFSKHAFAAEVNAGDFVGYGYGEAKTPILALQKSISEGVERVIYRKIKSAHPHISNSSGWACHLNSQLASASATSELLERDAVLVHWLTREPMTEINSLSWPTWLQLWTKNELSLSSSFNRLRILISTKGYVPTASVVIANSEGHGVSSHSTGMNLIEAIERALSEACRIAQIAMEFQNHLGTGSSIGKHIDHYAFKEVLPSWIYGNSVDWKTSEKQWEQKSDRFDFRKLDIKFHQVASGHLSVGYATCDQLQGLYFGDTKDAQEKGLINFDRLKNVGAEGLVNFQPHWVA